MHSVARPSTIHPSAASSGRSASGSTIGRSYGANENPPGDRDVTRCAPPPSQRLQLVAVFLELFAGVVERRWRGRMAEVASLARVLGELWGRLRDPRLKDQRAQRHQPDGRDEAAQTHRSKSLVSHDLVPPSLEGTRRPSMDPQYFRCGAACHVRAWIPSWGGVWGRLWRTSNPGGKPRVSNNVRSLTETGSAMGHCWASRTHISRFGGTHAEARRNCRPGAHQHLGPGQGARTQVRRP